MDVDQLAEYANLALTWIGFGTVVGLLAKAIMPGRDPGGAIATVLMGVVGTLIGCATCQYFWDAGAKIQPISLQGFGAGTIGAIVILFMYRILGQYWFVEGEGAVYHRRRRRRRSRVIYED